MEETINFRKPLPFINKIIFTENHVPLPLSDTEEIVYYNTDCKFSLKIGNGTPAYTVKFYSQTGYLFLTNERLIYRPRPPTENFESFFVLLSNITDVKERDYFEMVVHNRTSVKVFLTFADAHTEMFFFILRMSLDEKNDLNKYMWYSYDIKERLPLYCEALEEIQNQTKNSSGQNNNNEIDNTEKPKV
ncbi:hypothetical protein EDEG_03701 [Edhazardia aedis USNM 41457]|uniref:Uncharacterized protein n=1 Tax=Edhazardia aedis (strain USNM 41457) TaxID=1003232 RepID=J9D1T3_EDHAE|nr:hypothetical protein EDEG_03701 [Edhazardia aedis USNM 41457]|eukprot:EJW01811.1 hypothetical protein EDEG_03701 [Edhazardia aedis USNM 41457]